MKKCLTVTTSLIFAVFGIQRLLQYCLNFKVFLKLISDNNNVITFLSSENAKSRDKSKKNCDLSPPSNFKNRVADKEFLHQDALKYVNKLSFDSNKHLTLYLIKHGRKQ